MLLSTRWCDAHALPHELTYGGNDLVISVVHLCLPNPGGHGQASSCSHIPHTAALSSGPLSFFPLPFQPYPLSCIPLTYFLARRNAERAPCGPSRVKGTDQNLIQIQSLIPRSANHAASAGSRSCFPSTFSWSVQTQVLLQNH